MEAAPPIEMSESIDKLASAMADAQGRIKGAKRDSANPHFGSPFASLESVWDACREPLTANGLSVIQFPSMRGEDPVLVSVLAHSSGQWIRTYAPLTPTKRDPQAMGSAITYMRRYATMAIASLCPVDDDGEAALAPPREQARKEPTPASEKRGRLTNAVRSWSGVGEEDLVSAMASVKKACGIKNEQATDGDVTKMSKWVEEHVKKKTPFTEAVA